MGRIRKVFEKEKAFIAFLTGGDPDIETTECLIPKMAEAGADVIEIGIPFSDPIAEGIVIQEADIRALQAGVTTDKLFEMVVRVREKTQVPLVFMTYMNPIYTYGTERFLERCAQVGIDGVIIPDVPYEEKEEINKECQKAGIELISMIAPTSRQRIARIAREAEGFLYIVSSLGVTGTRSEITTDLASMVAVVREVTDIPCAIGFGISTPEQAGKIADQADGIIVGSAIVKQVEQYGKESAGPVGAFIKTMKNSLFRM